MDITSYLDFDTELDSALIQDVEQRLRVILKKEWPDLDTAPTSIFGDLILTPAARLSAFIEQTTQCVLSDLDLENAINGVICDCDFLQAYLKGLGVTSLADVNTNGIVRISFNEDATYTFDQGELLLFNDIYVFSFVAGNNSTITVGKYNPAAGETTIVIDPVENTYRLAATDLLYNSSTTNYDVQTFFVDLPVYGPASAEVSAGTLAAIDAHFGLSKNGVNGSIKDNIKSVELITDITPFEVPTNIQELIALTRAIQPSRNLTTKANAVSFVLNQYPNTVGASCVTVGDVPEMKRNTIPNVLAELPYVDLYVKGTNKLPTCTEWVHLSKTEDTDYFSISDIQFQHIPLYFTGLQGIDTTDAIAKKFATTYVTNKKIGNYIYITDAESGDAVSPTNQNCINTFKQRFSIFLTDVALDPSVETPVKVLASSKGWIGITYIYDPVAECASKFIGSQACGPILDLITKPFLTGYVNNLTITYRKTANKFFDRQQAQTDIYNFVNGLTYPTVYDDAYLGDILITNGASGISSITADITYSIVPGWKANSSSSDITQNTNIVSTQTTLSLNVPTTGNIVTQYGLGIRNVNYLMPLENLDLVERVIS